MASITFRLPDSPGRTDLKATRQKASDGAYWHFARSRYEPLGPDAAAYAVRLKEGPRGTYAAAVPDASIAGADVIDRLYAAKGDLTTADIVGGRWIEEEVTPSPASDALREENQALRAQVLVLAREAQGHRDRADRAELRLAEREAEARDVREFGRLLGQIVSRAANPGG